MPRRVRLFLFAVVASVALSTAACSNIAGPSFECGGGSQNSDTC